MSSLPRRHHDDPTSYRYNERIVVTSSVQLESQAIWNVPVPQHGSPKIPRRGSTAVVEGLLSTLGATRILLQASSQATQEYHHSSTRSIHPSGPSGVHVLVEWYRSEDATRDHFHAVLERLQHHRFLLAPLHAVTQPRLYRHLVRLDNHTLSVTLPMEGSSMASEGWRAFLQQPSPCQGLGIWNLATPTAYSTKMFLHHDQPQQRRSMWIEMQASEGYFQKLDTSKCQMNHSFGMIYERSIQDISLQQLLPGTSFRPCPLVNKTLIHLPDNTVQYLTKETNWKASVIQNHMTNLPSPSPLWTVFKTVLRPRGVSNAGTLQTIITSSNCSAMISILDIIPPYIRPKWTTLRVQVDGGDFAFTQRKVQRRDDGTVEMKHDIPVPPLTTLTVSLDFVPILLNFQSFPADPNRGMELTPTIVHVFPLDCHVDVSPIPLYSNSLLLLPPVPDMSMPFNVISLTCTMYVFCIGSIVNLLVKRASDKIRYAMYPEQTPISKWQRLKIRVKARWNKRNATTMGSVNVSMPTSIEKKHQ
jgi:Gpi16 subunit, GPI transamidase component